MFFAERDSFRRILTKLIAEDQFAYLVKLQENYTCLDSRVETPRSSYSLRKRVLSRLVVEKLAREKSAVVPHEFPQIA